MFPMVMQYLLLSILFSCRSLLDPAGHDTHAAIDSGVSDTEVVASEILCEGMEAGPLLGRVEGDTLMWMDDAGDVREAHTFSPPDDLYDFSVSAGRAGSFFAAVGYGYRYENSIISDIYSELVLFDADGEQLSFTDEVGGYREGVWLSADGVLAYAPGFENFNGSNPRGSGVLLHPDGQIEELVGWTPIGAAVEGAVPVCAVDDATLCGWYRDGEVTTTRLTHPVSQHGDRIAWLEGESLSIWQAGEASVALALPSAVSLQITDQQNGTLLISGTFGEDADPTWEPVARVDIESGQIEPFSMRPPEGWHVQDFSYCNVPLGRLHADTEVLLPFVGEEGVQIWSSPYGEKWTPMGASFEGEVGLATEVTGETVEIIGADMTRTFCVYESVDGPAALNAGDIQILRGDVARVVEGPSISWPVRGTGLLTPDGSCLMDEEVIYDLDTGGVQSLPRVGWGWIADWGL